MSSITHKSYAQDAHYTSIHPISCARPTGSAQKPTLHLLD